MQPLRYKTLTPQCMAILVDAVNKGITATIEYDYKQQDENQAQEAESTRQGSPQQHDLTWEHAKVTTTKTTNPSAGEQTSVGIKWATQSSSAGVGDIWNHAIFPFPGYQYKDIVITHQMPSPPETLALQWTDDPNGRRQPEKQPDGLEYPQMTRRRFERETEQGKSHPYPIGAQATLQLKNQSTGMLKIITGKFTPYGVEASDGSYHPLPPEEGFQILTVQTESESTAEMESGSHLHTWTGLWNHMTKSAGNWREKTSEVKNDIYHAFEIPAQQTHERNVKASRFVEWLMYAESFSTYAAGHPQLKIGKGLFEDTKIAYEAWKNSLPAWKIRNVMKGVNSGSDNIDQAVAKMTPKNEAGRGRNRQRFRQRNTEDQAETRQTQARTGPTSQARANNPRRRRY